MKKIFWIAATLFGWCVFSAEAQTIPNRKVESLPSGGNYKQAARAVAPEVRTATATVTVNQGMENSFNPLANSRNYKNQSGNERRPDAAVNVPIGKSETVVGKGESRNYKRSGETVYVPKPEKIPYQPMVNTDHDVLN